MKNRSLLLNPQILLPRLIEEFGYSKENAAEVVDDLSNCSEQIISAFLRWWNTGVLPDIEIEQYNVSRLRKEYGMNPIAALLSLDWLIKEPEEAKAALKRGYDEII